MAKTQPTLRVSELYCWTKKRRRRMAKRIYPNVAVRAARKDAQCMGLLKGRDSAQLQTIAAVLKHLPGVREAAMQAVNDNGDYELVVYSQLGLVTERDRREFIQAVRIKLMQMLGSEVTIDRLPLR